MTNTRTNRRNPFDYTQPVSRPDAFLGRRDAFGQIKAALNGNDFAQIIGQARIGKTSLLRAKLSELGCPVAIVSCKEDIACKARESTARSVASRLWERVTEELAAEIGSQNKELEGELKGLSRVFRDTDVFGPRDLHQVGKALASLEASEHILLAFDDVDALLSPDITDNGSLVRLLDCLLTMYEASQFKANTRE